MIDLEKKLQQWKERKLIGREDKHGKIEMERGSDDHEKCLINSELEKKISELEAKERE